MNFYRRLLQHGAVWTNGRQRITIEMNDDSLTIRLLSDLKTDGNVHLYASFHELWREGWRVRIDDLNCCKFPDAWGQGIGRLMVNLAVQCVRLRFAGISAPVIIAGEAVPDAGARERNYAFWQQSGLVIEDSESARSPMSCPLAEFTMLDKGVVYGGIPSMLSIKAFVVAANQQYCLAADVDAVRSIQCDLQSMRIPSDSELRALQRQASAQDSRALLLSGAAFYLFSGVVAFSESGIAGAVCAISATAGGILAKQRGLLTNLGTAGRRLQQEQRIRESRIEMLRSELRPLLERDDDAVTRLIEWYALPASAITWRHTQSLERLQQGAELSDSDIIAISECVAALQEAIKNEGREPPKDSHSDFLFGENCDTFHESTLAEWARTLEDQYAYHLERLLSNVDTVRIAGSSNTKFDRVLSSITNHVGYIEFYREGSRGAGDLSAKICLQNGELRFSCIWTACTDTHAGEIAQVLQGLSELGLLDKVFIRWDGKALTRIAQPDVDAMQDILVLLDQPHYSESEIKKWFRRGLSAVE